MEPNNYLLWTFAILHSPLLISVSLQSPTHSPTPQKVLAEDEEREVFQEKKKYQATQNTFCSLFLTSFSYYKSIQSGTNL